MTRPFQGCRRVTSSSILYVETFSGSAEWASRYIFILHFLDISCIYFGSYWENIRGVRKKYLFLLKFCAAEQKRAGKTLF